MARPWDAEIELTPERAAGLIEEQFPALSPRPVVRLGSGWDNDAFLTADGIVFRFPRRAAAAGRLETEARVLPTLAPMLPLQVPDPRWRGRPAERFPWTFLGYRRLPGRTASEARLSDASRRAAAPLLARFLARLHAIDPAPLHVPGDELDRRDVASRLPLMVERLDVVRGAGIVSDAGPWLTLFGDFEADRRARPDRLVHGDLYARHLLVGAGERLTGVLDWGDVHAGDPALDLMLVYGFLPASARGAFLREYGPVDASALRAARLRAAFHAVSVTWHGIEAEDRELVDEGRRALRYVLEG